ncbi:amine oxidase [flavin-containing]-like [Amphiura filiformis]|uniref:amine oxidase [flavin-containing]-like n=1 Tax=Amphiura filiformis TaxID=82378 RepID=UPI003B20D1D3
MEGAVQAGERASREILCDMGMISESEIWESEPPSEEVQPRPFDVGFWVKYSPTVSGLFKSLAKLSVVSGLTGLFIYHRYKQVCR